jgi:hypothetical protein
MSMILVATLSYTAVQVVALGTLPGLAQSESPLAEAAGLFMGGWGALVLTVGAIVSIVGNVGNTILIGPRYVFALAADGYGPRWLARVHPRFRTPRQRHLHADRDRPGPRAVRDLRAAGDAVGDRAPGHLYRHLGRHRAAAPHVRPPSRSLPDPRGAVIPVAALLLTFVLLASAGWENLLAGAITLVVGAAIYRFCREPVDGGVEATVSGGGRARRQVFA